MGENAKTLRQVLLGKVQRAVVTHADVDAESALALDRELMDAAGFLVHEKIELYDVTSGARLAAEVVPAERGGGEVRVDGAGAHLVRPGELVVLASYGWLKEKAAAKHRPRVVLVDDQNRVTAVSGREAEAPPKAGPAARMQVERRDERKKAPGGQKPGEPSDAPRRGEAVRPSKKAG